MHHWPKFLLRPLLASLFFVPLIGLLSPVDAFGFNAFHPVTFNENDSLSDTVDTYQTLNSPTDLTLFAALSPSFSDAGHVFSDWNTNPDGSGTSYSDGQLYSFDVGLTLYAQWSQVISSLSFSANGGTGAISSIAGPMGSTVAVPSANSLSFANHIFVDWNTQLGGGGVSYLAGASFLLNNAQTLYAQWSTVGPVTTIGSSAPGPATLVVTFDTDGASGILNPVTLGAGTSIQLPMTTSLSNPGYVFDGWFSSAVGGQALGQGGSTLTPASSETAFAQWSATPSSTLSFSSNQGRGTVVEITGVTGSSVTISSSKGLSHPGSVFTGWNTAANGSGSDYASGAQFTLSGATTLYAQWSSVSVTKHESLLIGSVGPFASSSTKLTNLLMAQVRRIAIAMRSQPFVAVALYGYDAGPGSNALHMSLSTQRAVLVVEYLRVELARLHVKRVVMTARGEGETRGFTAAMFRRVEIFAN